LGVAKLPGAPTLRGSPTDPVGHLTSFPIQEKSVSSEPTLSADVLLEQLRDRFEKLCREVADAVNQAPAGQVINASEEQVRDLLADFRTATYQAAIQLRTDAAQAAFPPSAAPRHEQTLAEQGP
jgi:hypothetical protein